MDTEIGKAFDLAKDRLAQFKQLTADLDALAVKEQELKASFLKENADVEKVETKNITTVFYSVVGSLDRHVEKESSEALAAKQKYDQVLKDMDYVKYQISALTAGQTGFADCQNEYDSLYAQKRDEIIRENDETAQKLLALEDSASKEKINLKKINDALVTAGQVFDIVNTAVNKLNKAIGLGMSPAITTDLLNYARVQEAVDEIESNQYLLLQLKAELDEVYIKTDFMVGGNDYITFAFDKVFVPGVIADWGAASKISKSKKSQESVVRIKAKLWDVVEALKIMSAKSKADIEGFEADMDNLIINA